MRDPSSADTDRYRSDLEGKNVDAAMAYMNQLGLQPSIVHGDSIVGSKPTSRCADLSYNELKVIAHFEAQRKVTSAEVRVIQRPPDM